MEQSIYFIRHARSDSAHRDERTRPLTKAGHVAAAELVGFFRNVVVGRVFSSPFLRAVDTVLPLSIDKGLPLERLEDLRERDVGQWFPSQGAFAEFSRRQWEDFSLKLPGGESLGEVQARNLARLHSILGRPGLESAVVGTHGAALCTILNALDPAYGYAYYEAIANIMPLVIRVDFSEGRAVSIHELFTPLIHASFPSNLLISAKSADDFRAPTK